MTNVFCLRNLQDGSSSRINLSDTYVNGYVAVTWRDIAARCHIFSKLDLHGYLYNNFAFVQILPSIIMLERDHAHHCI